MSDKNPPILYLILPCYNEEDILPDTLKTIIRYYEQLVSKKKIASKSKILLIDDGSQDKTWSLIESYKSNSLINALKLSRNYGHQNALITGLNYAFNKCDIAITMDADLQDDYTKIEEMIEKYQEGYDMVLGIRVNRDSDSKLKSGTAQLFYRINALLGNRGVYNNADFNLFSAKVLNHLVNYQESNLYLRGLYPELTNNYSTVEYTRKTRTKGKTHYSYFKMFNLALNGITSSSVVPLRIISISGFFIAFISLLITIYSLVVKILGYTVTGWTFTILSIWFLGGVQILFLGVIGEYLGKIHLESKHRPRANIDLIID